MHKLWISSIGCPKDKEMPLPTLGSPNLEMNISLMLTRTGPRSRKPLRQHSPPMMQQHRFESPSPHLIKTRRSPWDSTNISPSSLFFLFTPESLTITSCWNGSFVASTSRSLSNSLSMEPSKPPPTWRNSIPRPQRSKGVTAVLPPSGEDLSHCMEEVTVITTPTL